jgi:hypothetical protein
MGHFYPMLALFQKAPPLLLLTSLSVSQAEPVSHYVAPNGNDSDAGSTESPFRTLSKAYSVVGAGDTIYLRGGTYPVASQITLSKSGEAGMPIEIFAYPGETPVLDGSTMSHSAGTAIIRITGNYHHVRGIDIVRSTDYGMRVLFSASHNIIERNRFYRNGRNSDWGGSGFNMRGSGSHNLILNNDSFFNRDLNDNNADGFQFTSTGTGNVLRGNRAWNNIDDGFDGFQTIPNETAAPFIIEENWAWKNGFDENGLAGTAGSGSGFKLGGGDNRDDRKSGGHLVQRNLSWNNRRWGFSDNGAELSITFFNNTAYNNPTRDFWCYGQGESHVLRNNLAYAGGTISSDCKEDSIHNSWDAHVGITVRSTTFRSLDDSIARGARQTNGSLPESDFLQLTSNSNAIDRGIDVGLVYYGAAPDLGKFEHANR